MSELWAGGGQSSEVRVSNQGHSQPYVNSDSSIKAIHQTSRKESGSTSNTSPRSDQSPLDQLVTPSSDGTSFITARSRPNSSIYSSIDYLEHMVKQQQEDEDEEIDYSILNAGMHIGQPSSSTSPPPKDNSDAESIKTIRPDTKNKPEDSMATAAATAPPPASSSRPPPTHRKKQKSKHVYRNSSTKKPLVWKKAGSVFVSRLPTVVTPEPASIPTGRPIKREPILCMRSATGCLSNEPTRYKAAKEARYDLLTEKWRQVELVLTASYLTTYSSSVSRKCSVAAYQV